MHCTLLWLGLQNKQVRHVFYKQKGGASGSGSLSPKATPHDTGPPILLFFRSGVTRTPRGGAVNCAQVKILGKLFRDQSTLSAHPSQLEIGLLSSSLSGEPQSS